MNLIPLSTAALLLLLGLLGVAHPFLAKRPGGAPWWLLVGQALVGLRALLFGVLGQLEAVMHIEWVTTWPIYWLTNLSASCLEVGLPALFAFTFLASLGNPEASKTGLSRRLSIAQAVVGAIAVLLVTGVVVMVLVG